jgi:Fe2+ transport system protein FeoA
MKPWKQPPATVQEAPEPFAREAQAALDAAESGETPAPPSAGLAQAQSAAPSAGLAQARPAAPPGSLYRHGVTLAELQPGECGTVRRFLSTKQGRLRLLEMGLTPGTHVKVIRVAAFGGPLDILVRGYQLSLRRDEAAAVWLDD